MLQVLLMTKHQVASKQLQHDEIRCADFQFCEGKKELSLSSNTFSFILLLSGPTLFFVYKILQYFLARFSAAKFSAPSKWDVEMLQGKQFGPVSVAAHVFPYLEI